VTVTTAAPLLQTAEASLGVVVDHRRLLICRCRGQPHVPASICAWHYLGQRSHIELATSVRFAISNFATDGASNNTSEITLDGMPNMMRDRINRVPAPEMLQEVRVQTQF